MKIRKLTFYLIALFIAISLIIFSGMTTRETKISLKLVLNDNINFQKTYSLSQKLSMNINFFYRGNIAKYYKTKFLDSPKLFFDSLNKDINIDIEKFFASIETPPVSPKAIYLGNGIFQYEDGKNGVCIDRKKTLKTLAENCFSKVFFSIISPTYTLEDIKKSTQKASSFSTNYQTSKTERKHNIELAASKLTNVAVFPGTTFSFNETVGKRTLQNGFAKAKVIQNGVYEIGIGGGVCQVSTTLYNAWLKTGQNATFSRPHSLTPSYVSPGLDAMVTDASDLLLHNATNHTMYISAKADGINLTIEIYTLPLPCKIKLTSQLIKEIPTQEYLFTDEPNIFIPPKNGGVYQSYREYIENGEIYIREFLRTSTYLPQKGKKSIETNA